MADSCSDCSGRRERAERLLVVGFLALLGGCWSSQPSPPPAATASSQSQEDTAVDDLLDLMRKRLLLMHEVAKWKWNEGKPITDPKREEELLAELEHRGIDYGLSRKQARDFMVAQMEAGKLVQEADFAKWERGGYGRFNDVRDLNTALRPLIEEVSDRMLAQFAKVVPMIRDDKAKATFKQRADTIVHGDGIHDMVKTSATRPLLKSQRTP